MRSPAGGCAGMRAVEAVARIRAGALASVDLVTACIDHVERTDAELRAWARLDREAALDEARAMDSLRQRGLPLGALHGVPVAVEEVFGGVDDTPADRDPDASTHVSGGEGTDGGPANGPARGDPAVVERLREAGAVVIGKTRAGGPIPGRLPVDPASPARPGNPHDARRTAGGPCGAAAAAVAAGQVPLAVTCEGQGGAMLCASFCGVFGFRPTRGVISRRGVRSSSPTLDQVGVFGRDLEDAALLADALGGHDAADPASYPRPRPRMREGLRSRPPVEPDFIWLDMPCDDRLCAAEAEGFGELRDCLGERIVRLPAPAWFGRLPAAHRIIREYEAAAQWWKYGRKYGVRPGAPVPETAERGAAHGEDRYREALAAMTRAQDYFSEFFHHYDAVVAPAAAGEAPPVESGTDAPVFCEIAALCGLPSLCVPLLEGQEGLPIGVQLTGSGEGDDRLLRSAGWLIEQVLADAARPEPVT